VIAGRAAARFLMPASFWPIALAWLAITRPYQRPPLRRLDGPGPISFNRAGAFERA